MSSGDGGVLALLAAMNARDECTHEHAQRVVRLSIKLGERADLDDGELALLNMAASLHDIGKMGIPDGILLKPGPLGREERILINTHVTKGAHIVSHLAVSSAGQVAEVVRQHHENLDGSGYPDGLRGSEILTLARIIRICDSYDAITSRRNYRPALLHSEALQILEDGVGSVYDPDLLAEFFTLTATEPTRRAAPADSESPCRGE